MQDKVATIPARRSGKTYAAELASHAARAKVTDEQREEFRKKLSDQTVTIDEAADIPPGRLSIDPNSPDFHPSYVRVGVLVDGVERNDLQFYDVKRLEYMTTAKTSHLAESIEPYWRFAESRQQRRARERWEGKRK